jgi:hypothetical protein
MIAHTYGGFVDGPRGQVWVACRACRALLSGEEWFEECPGTAQSLARRATRASAMKNGEVA